VAVWAKQPQIFQAIVPIVSIDVVKLEWNCPTKPSREFAGSAFCREESLLQEAILEFERADARHVFEIGLCWAAWRILPAAAPSSTDEVCRVDLMARERPTQHFVVPP